jgi:hypothetical protein
VTDTAGSECVTILQDKVEDILTGQTRNKSTSKHIDASEGSYTELKKNQGLDVGGGDGHGLSSEAALGRSTTASQSRQQTCRALDDRLRRNDIQHSSATQDAFSQSYATANRYRYRTAVTTDADR